MDSMRAWLRENRPDLKVGVRGRISAEAQQAYNQAHGKDENGSAAVPVHHVDDPSGDIRDDSGTGKASAEYPTLLKPCGFCADGHHESCPVIIHAAVRGEDRYCPCAIRDVDGKDHPRKRGFE